MSPFARCGFGLVILLAIGFPTATSFGQTVVGEELDSPLLRDPETPEAAFKATVLMVDIARPKLARRYLELFNSMMPDDDALLDLRQKYGPEAFLKLGRIRELQPQSTQLLDRMNEAFRKRARDPERVSGLIGQLTGTADERANAVLTLREGGADVVPQLLASVDTPQFAGAPEPIVLALTKFGGDVVPPLLGTVASPEADEEQRRIAIEVLGFKGDKDDVVELWYPAFAKGESPGIQLAAREAIGRILRMPESRLGPDSGDGVLRELKRVALEHFSEKAPRGTTPGKTIEMWTWIPVESRVGRIEVDARMASLFDATRFARQAVGIAPEDAEAQSLYLASDTAMALARNGWANGLPSGPGTAFDLAVSSGAAPALRGLDLALEHENPLAALAMLTVLARVGTENDLHAVAPATSPIVAALNSGDPRVQFAAANTILVIDPRKPFPQASRVVEILTRAITDDGDGRVAVVDSSIQRGRTMATLFGQLGYVADSARTGRDGFRLAAERGDVTLVALQANVARWELTQTIANLRADARTRALPIVVYGDAQYPTRNVEALSERYQPIHFVDFGIREETVLDQVRPFVQSVQSPLTAEQRTEQMTVALSWLSHIAEGRRTEMYDLAPAESPLFVLASDPNLAPSALVALGAIPRASAQLRLQELTVNDVNPPVTRRLAALHLAHHIGQFGLLLSDGQSGQVMRTWETETDPAIAAALSSVAGSLAPNARRVGDRILATPPVRLVPSAASEQPPGDEPGLQ